MSRARVTSNRTSMS